MEVSGSGNRQNHRSCDRAVVALSTAPPLLYFPGARPAPHRPSGALRDIVGAWLSRFKTVNEAVDALTAARVPCAPALSREEVVAHPHLEARGFFPSVPHPARGAVRVTGTPFRLDGHTLGPQGPAPYRVGEHTRAVLEGVLGYAPARIEELVARGVAAGP